MKHKLRLLILGTCLKNSIRKKCSRRITSTLWTTEAAPSFQNAVVDLAQFSPPILTALLMRNFTEKSSKIINRALTCTNFIFPQENILPNCCKGSKQTENLLYWNPELRITGILSIFIQSSQNHLKYYVFSSSIQQANLAKQVSDSIHSALNIQVTRLHFPPSTRQQ